jgi:hypothetical protein
LPPESQIVPEHERDAGIGQHQGRHRAPRDRLAQQQRGEQHNNGRIEEQHEALERRRDVAQAHEVEEARQVIADASEPDQAQPVRAGRRRRARLPLRPGCHDENIGAE